MLTNVSVEMSFLSGTAGARWGGNVFLFSRLSCYLKKKKTIHLISKMPSNQTPRGKMFSLLLGSLKYSEPRQVDQGVKISGGDGS